MGDSSQSKANQAQLLNREFKNRNEDAQRQEMQIAIRDINARVEDKMMQTQMKTRGTIITGIGTSGIRGWKTQGTNTIKKLTQDIYLKSRYLNHYVPKIRSWCGAKSTPFSRNSQRTSMKPRVKTEDEKKGWETQKRNTSDRRVENCHIQNNHRTRRGLTAQTPQDGRSRGYYRGYQGGNRNRYLKWTFKHRPDESNQIRNQGNTTGAPRPIKP